MGVWSRGGCWDWGAVSGGCRAARQCESERVEDTVFGPVNQHREWGEKERKERGARCQEQKKKREERDRLKKSEERVKWELGEKERKRREKAGKIMMKKLREKAEQERLNTRTVYRQQRAPASVPPTPPPLSRQQMQQQQSMNMMQVVIPNGIGPGQQMRVALPNGQQCAVVVPQGYRAGMTLTIQVPIF